MDGHAPDFNRRRFRSATSKKSRPPEAEGLRRVRKMPTVSNANLEKRKEEKGGQKIGGTIRCASTN